jgi:hypothetical protein
MSKKPKHSRHRVPVLAVMEAIIDDGYQAEIDQSQSRLEARYRKAEKALAAAELKAERNRTQAESLARKQAESAVIAANRLANERRLTENIERIKQAARNSRVAEARAELERKHKDAVSKRNAETEARKLEAKQAREREELIRRSRLAVRTLEDEVFERRRELHEIKLLMMPGSYAGSNHRGRSIRHTAGERR